MKFIRVKSLWPEKEHFYLERPDTGEEYIFLHFLSPAEVWLDGRWNPVETGACIFYDAHSLQRFRTKENRLLHDWFHAEGDCRAVMKKYKLSFNQLYYPAHDERITRLIQEIELEMLSRKPFFEDICALKAEELFAHLARFLCPPEHRVAVQHDIRQRFVELRSRIHQTFEQDWTVEKMALEISLSPSRFYSLYKQIFDLTPKHDLQITRIEHAKILLMQNRYTVEQIAEMAGYRNPYHFIRQFKQFTGVTPGKYAKS